MQTYLTGLFTMLPLIVAIGAQNAFILRQGLLREHVFAVCLFCAVSDAVLIAFGVFSAGWLTGIAPWFSTAMTWGGAVFLFAYGARSFLSAWRGGAALRAGARAGSLGAAIATAAALTFLNPHVYLDTVVLVGAISARFEDKTAYAAGAMSASFLFFFTLGYGARLLAPIFARPRAWQVLDVLIGLVMWAIALKLVTGVGAAAGLAPGA
ncbi:MAG: LysE/ArgO family amino acid transporter [Paracoccus sp. (in: a-proteobacteria)]|nr:LysE/ArgO family amino acid transporter [Paracoccus sp. (in: a-proteobacteria)]